jgi:hypothetical protein
LEKKAATSEDKPPPHNPGPGGKSYKMGTEEDGSETWFEGKFLEVKDTYGDWLTAEVKKVNKKEAAVYIKYEGWISKWDEWLLVGVDDPKNNLARVRPLGADIADTEEIRKAKEQDVRFFLELFFSQSQPNLDFCIHHCLDLNYRLRFGSTSKTRA